MIERTVTVRKHVDRAALGLGHLGPSHPNIELGQASPLMRNGEDAEALARCAFLEPGTPVEINVLAAETIRRALTRTEVQRTLDEKMLQARQVLGSRPAIGYLPPEALFGPANEAAARIAEVGPSSMQFATHMRNGHALSSWAAAQQDGSLTQFLFDYFRTCRRLGINVAATPTLPIHQGTMTSPVEQMRINNSIITAATQPTGPAGEPGDPNSIGLLYPLHMAPNALSDVNMVRAAVAQTVRGLEFLQGRVWGVHINFIDIASIGRDHQKVAMTIDLIKDLEERVVRERGLLLLLSDVGPAAPALLDAGASFASYHTGATPRKIYGVSGPSDADAQCGKVLGLWDYNLYSRAQLRQRGDELDETGLFPHRVPADANGSPKKFRVLWGRPRNVSVLERVNHERTRELEAGHAKPGVSFVGRSHDKDISPWAW
ncbi:MAG: hypothetical protein HYT80_02440 [Euryarchaeota archaeon]|nr:hypothetical protein [Euryarchaeota archaeon]